MNQQEEFWQGEFGNEYTERNCGDFYKVGNLNFWAEITNLTGQLNSTLELGCNRGLNLDAINDLHRHITLRGIEINKKAVAIAIKKKYEVLNLSISEKIPINLKSELVFTSGVLIHINPNKLENVYRNLYNLSSKYILINEYFSTNPEEILYRSTPDRLWKRDFAKELKLLYPELELIKYGFNWRYDKSKSSDDTNWFLFRK